MSAARFCSRCGGSIRRNDGEDRCAACGRPPVLDALAEVVPVLVDLRDQLERIEERGERTEQHVEGLREDVNVLAATVIPPRAPAAYVGLGEMARRLGVTRDWLYRFDRPRRLGGFQSGKHGRWRFDPDRTRALFAELYGPKDGPSPPRAGEVGRARPLPGRVPLLPVKDEAA